MDGYVLSWEMLVTECVECHVGEAIGVPNNISGGGGRRAGADPVMGQYPSALAVCGHCSLTSQRAGHRAQPGPCTPCTICHNRYYAI